MKASKRREIKRSLIIAGIALALIATFIISFGNNKVIPDWNSVFKFFGIAPETDENEDYIRFMDVGQGDCILIRSNGYSAVIDTGPEDSSRRGSRELELCCNGNIDALVETHLHMDHVGGLETIMENFKVKNLVLPDLNTDSEGFRAAKTAKNTVAETDGGVYTAVQGMNLNIGEFEITVLAVYEDLENENDRSIITMIEIDGIKFLLMGDAEAAAENRLMNENIDFDCDVLKVGHHGSSTSTTMKFLRKASPRYAVISVGKDNSYSHPSSQTLDSLQEVEAEIFRTDEDGDITFYVDDKELDIELENYNS